MSYVAAVLTLGLVVWVLWWSVQNWNQKDKRRVVVTNIVTLVVILVLSWYAFPVFSSWFVYRVIWLNFFYIVPVFLGVSIIYRAYIHWDKSRRPSVSLIGIYVILGVVIAVGGVWFLPSMERWQAAEVYSPTKIDEEVSVDPNSVRFTPLSVAYRFMENTITSSKYTVEEDLTDPMNVDGSFGYVTPVTPDGVFQTMLAKVDGFVVYNDDPSLEDENRLRRVDQSYKVGESMEWQDNIRRTLYRADMFCLYPEIFYLQLDPENTDRFTAVAPKIKYRYQFPIFWVPTWGGVTLVHDDGRTEELSPEEAMKDSRLQGNMVFPMELARYMVEVQIFDEGLFGGFYNREGKIEIPTLPGDNQMPFFIVGEDGNLYAMVSVEPAGQSSALFRQYYVNLSSGEFTYYQYDESTGVLGPRAAIDQVKGNLRGYKWIETGDEEGESGDFRVIQPRPLPLQGTLYWLTTVTSRDYSGITSTPVLNAASREVVEYESRDQFNTWLNQPAGFGSSLIFSGDSILTSGVSASSRLEEIESFLLQALEEIRQLKEQARDST